ncbi:MAG TPA: hypothetical protein VNZ03_29990 [Terriglobales bacterium]|nr:hypothetical protein [Terriglobales bacterium]
MKITKLVTLALAGGILLLNAQAQTAGPLLWTSYLDMVGNYVRSESEGVIVSRFTPGAAITVTRVQLQAAHGSSIFSSQKCSRVPKIAVSDGTTKYVLAIPNARQTGPDPFSVHADSGTLALSFPSNANLRLNVIPGEPRCNAGSININVQYSVN